MINIDEILAMPPYSLAKDEKEKILTSYLLYLTDYHIENCKGYSDILNAFNYDKQRISSYYDLPFLPVRLFKEYDLMSIEKEEAIKLMTSSGTTKQVVSKIYLDKKTSILQSKVLTKIVSDYVGNKRMPMIIIDTQEVIKNPAMFSARGAGIKGFSIFGRDTIFALDENMELRFEELKEFIAKHQDEKIFLFGFTFMIWQHFIEKLKKKEKKLNLSNSVLFHGGGWKKLVDLNISSQTFKDSLKEVANIERVHDYYGMVEQTGSIYIECECGHLHCSNFSDVIIRRYNDFSIADIGEEGLVEVVSLLPHSYPGHVLLTEDKGVILGEDDCSCGRKGKYIKITGRIKNAEIRGCSDTYATRF